jgi:CubicO group peptidase (beta-lactamase class C family)
MKVEPRLSRKNGASRIDLLAVALLAASMLLVGCGESAPGEETWSAAIAATNPVSSESLARFEAKVESLRETLKIPGISAAIVKDEELVWAQGFGMANLEDGIEATTETPYGLASVTKPFAAVLLMKLVEEGRLDPDTPVAEFGIELESDGIITVRHLLSHTSEGVPGGHYQYSGSRYSYLTTVIEQLYGLSFRRVLRREILEPLEMTDTALNVGGCGFEYDFDTLDADDPERAFEHVYRSAATPYLYDANYEVYPAAIPTYTNAAAGLISTVVDLAKFAVAIEQDELVAAETKERMFTPTRLNSGDDGPYGLGWFTERYGEAELIWHYGYGAYSSLFLMVPSEGLTFIVLANTQNLSRPFGLGGGDVSVLASPFALAFFKAFVLQPRFSEPLPEIEWTADTDTLVKRLSEITEPELRELYEGELWTTRKMYEGAGRSDAVSGLITTQARVFPEFGRSADDVYQVERPGPRPADIDRVTLTEDEAARWIGRYRLRPEDAASGLPLEIEIGVYGDRILAISGNHDCQELLPLSPVRAATAENPDLLLLAEGAEGPFKGARAEYAGALMGAYDRIETPYDAENE